MDSASLLLMALFVCSFFNFRDSAARKSTSKFESAGRPFLRRAGAEMEALTAEAAVALLEWNGLEIQRKKGKLRGVRGA